MLVSHPAFREIFPWLAAILGLCLGSFYSVCAHRYQTGASIVRPGSHCPACKTPLSALELVPVVSWLFLRGRCRSCGARIPVLYPALELISGLWAYLAALKFGPSPLFLFLMIMGGLYITASMIDLDSFILPNRLTYPAAVLAVAGAAFLPHVDLGGALIGAGVGYALFWGLAKAYLAAKGVDGLGGGDVKLMLSIGALVGWRGLSFAVLMGSLAALIASPIFLRSGGGEKNSIPIPFGPFLCFGAMAQALYGPEIQAAIAAI